MKTFIIFFTALCLCTFSLTAQQTPKSFSFQGVAKDADGIVTGGIGLQFTIQQGAPGGQTVYRERQFPNTTDDGVFSVNIGDPEALVIEGNIAEIDWSQGPFFLRVELDPNGAANYSDMGTTQLLSVPFAMYADQARTVQIEGDGDPTNELQTLNFTNNTLSLNNGGGSVDLSNYESLWQRYNSLGVEGLSYTSLGEITIGNTSPLSNTSSRLAIAGDMRFQGNNTRTIIGVGANATYSSIRMLGVSSNQMVYLGTNSGNDYGLLTLSTNNQRLTTMSIASSLEAGFIGTYSTNGQPNVSLTTLLGNDTHGFLSVRGTDGATEAGVYVDSDGRGVVFGEVKNFRIPHPNLSDHDIWYASLEGGEAAAYARGTTTLVNGEVFVPYSDDFSIVVNPNTVTVSLTPLSANSTGLAVIEKKEDGFLIKELNQGTGNYQLDWEVKGVRKGFEDYEVVRHRSYSEPSAAATAQ